MIAAIDSGNSAVKLGIFDQQKLIYVNYSAQVETIPGLLRNHPVHRVIISDVAGKKNDLVSALGNSAKILHVRHDLKFPFHIRYGSPETLGTDRISSVAGAWDRYGGSDILVINAGTCITYDLIDKEGNYLGGGISPGIDLRLKSLHAFTASLPDVLNNGDYVLIGDDTESSIRGGTIGGAVEEIYGMIGRYRIYYPDLKTVMCGGSSAFFESKIKGTIFVHPELVLWGLRVIAEHNEI
jgi:type III pantothenate kinase